MIVSSYRDGGEDSSGIQHALLVDSWLTVDCSCRRPKLSSAVCHPDVATKIQHLERYFLNAQLPSSHDMDARDVQEDDDVLEVGRPAAVFSGVLGCLHSLVLLFGDEDVVGALEFSVGLPAVSKKLTHI